MARRKTPEAPLSALQLERVSQIEACERRGEPLSAYARRRGLSVRALYEAKRQARKAGLTPAHRSRPGPRERATRRTAQPRFVEAVPAPVADPTPAPTSIAWRLRLPTGAVLECSTPLDLRAMEQILSALDPRS